MQVKSQEANQIMNRNRIQTSISCVDSSNNFMNLALKFFICKHEKEKQDEKSLGRINLLSNETN